MQQPSPQSSQDTCQALFRALVHKSVYSQPCTWIRILDTTSECDRYYDLSALRKLYQDALGEERMYRIRECVESMRDQRKAQQACMHFHASSHLTITQGLSWKTWLESWWD